MKNVLIAGCLTLLAFNSALAASGNTVIATGYNLSDDQTYPTSALIMRSVDNGINWSIENLKDVFPNNPLFEMTPVFSSDCTSADCLITASSLQGVAYKYFIVQSDALQANWHSINIDNLWPKNTFESTINGMSCVDNECAMIGTYTNYYSQLTHPIFFVSHDHGQNWLTTTIPNVDSKHAYTPAGVSCTSSYCVGVGQYYYSLAPFSYPIAIMVSSAANQTWTQVTDVKNAPLSFLTTREIAGISCQGKICFVMGNYLNKIGHIYPLLIESNDAGNTWSYVNNVFDNYQNGLVENAKCSGDNCVVVGQTPNKLFVAITSDAGKSWSMPTLPTLPATIWVKDVNCNNNACVIVGTYKKNKVNEPLIITTQDNGKTWKVITQIAGVSDDGSVNYDLVAIHADNQKSFVVVGSAAQISPLQTQPLVLVSNDNGMSWIRVKSLVANNASLNSVSGANLQKI